MQVFAPSRFLLFSSILVFVEKHFWLERVIVSFLSIYLFFIIF